MNREELENRIIDYIDGRLTEEEKGQLEKELAANAESYQLYEQFREVMQAMDQSEKLDPRATLKLNFEKMLREEMAREKKGRQVFFQPVLYRAAAAIILVAAGVAIGYVVNNNLQQQKQIAQLQEQMRLTKQAMMAM